MTSPTQSPQEKAAPHRITRARARALVIALLVLALIVIASQDALYSAVRRVLDSIGVVIAAHPILGAALFVALSAASAMLAFVSSAALVPIAVLVWGPAVCALLLWLGWILGGVCAYGIGRTFGQRVVTRLTSPATLARYKDRLTKRTPIGLVFLFQLAVPSEIPGYVLGMADYPLKAYLVALAAAELPYVLGTVFLGEGLLQRRLPLLLAVGAASVLLAVIAWKAFSHHVLQPNVR
ncbi:MAG TPA: VTT domain-containing protein [Gemmatimonadaceae bacterium]|nr:VTT domain-containing protein [Gemmatimonadaceae bacterium]